jgi:hypothetical protein
MTSNNEEAIAQIVEDKLAAMLGGFGGFAGPPPAAPVPMTLEEVLEEIDPRDSESAQAMFAWLQRNGRIHKMGMLDNVGYLLVYSEPEGSSKAGWTHGGTQGDRIVSEALEKAQAAGAPALKGLCPRCYSPIIKRGENEAIEAESPRPGSDPTVCTDGGPHEFAN